MKQVVFVQIGTDFFAIEIGQVEHFASNMKVSDSGGKAENPNTIGMICFEDEVIPVLNLYKLLKQGPIDFCEKTIFVIMMFRGKSFAFPINAVIRGCNVPSECFHEIPDAFGPENGGVFKEVIEREGTLYIKISAETIEEKMILNMETSSKLKGSNQNL